MPISDVSAMKVADLRRELKLRGLSLAGNKNELQERLQSVIEGEPLLEDGSLVGEDILDEEEGVLSDEEKILGADENELLKSPSNTPTTILPKTIENNNRDAVPEDDILESPTNVTKKIVLKRKNSFNSVSANDSISTTKENTEPSATKSIKMSERNPITIGENKKAGIDQGGTAVTKKLVQLTMQERLELRAKKFGIETKTKAEAAVSSNEKNSAISAVPSVSNEKQVELLKKRAERFGCVTSTNLAKLDAEERLLKRKQRFCSDADVAKNPKTALNDNSSSAATTKISSEENSKDEWAEKARKRLERFKGSVATTVSHDSIVDVASIPTTIDSA